MSKNLFNYHTNIVSNDKRIIIIGAGIAGATLARKMAENDYHVDLFEEKAFIGGNCYDTYNSKGVLYHRYGPHIFHTDKKEVVEFVTRFAQFNNYVHNVVAKVNQKFIELPISLSVLKNLYPRKYQSIEKELKRCFHPRDQISILDIIESNNHFLSKPFSWIFKNIYQPYTEKMWGVPINQINREVLNRVRISLTEKSSYFPNAIFQGLPVGGYTHMIKNILNHKKIHLYLNVNACKHLVFGDQDLFWMKQKVSFPVVYCGSIDRLFNYQFGVLPYRSLEFKFLSFNKDYVQKFSVINYPKHPTMTRSVEYKLLTKQKCDGFSVISREFPGEYNPGKAKWNIPYYPLFNPSASQIYQEYRKLASVYPHLHLLGRLAEYRYYNMDDVINQAIELSKKIAL